MLNSIVVVHPYNVLNGVAVDGIKILPRSSLTDMRCGKGNGGRFRFPVLSPLGESSNSKTLPLRFLEKGWRGMGAAQTVRDVSPVLPGIFPDLPPPRKA